MCRLLVRWLCILAVGSATPGLREHEFLVGFVEGFLAGGGTEVKDCITSSIGATTDVKALLRELLRGDFPGAAADLKKLVLRIGSAVPDCKTSVHDLDAVAAVLGRAHNLRQLLSNAGHNFFESGLDISSTAGKSVAACKASQFQECGMLAGSAMRLFIIGEIPSIPQPPYNTGMHNKTFDEMQRAEASDSIEVYWNLSPLCMEQFRKWLGPAGLWHNSVWFKNLRTGLNATIEFAANSFGHSLILPKLNYSDRTVNWNNTAKFKAKEGALDTHYWDHRTHIATINGSTYNSLLSWAATKELQQFDKYFMFNLVTKSGHMQMSGFTCADGAAKVVDQIFNLAGPCVFNNSAPGLFRSDTDLWASENAEPVPASANKAVFDFYDALLHTPQIWSLNLTDTLKEIDRIAAQIHNGRMVYKDQGGQYWTYVPHKPVLSWRTSYMPLPRGCGDAVVLV